MASVMPKIKLYIFISFFQMLFNMTIFVLNFSSNLHEFLGSSSVAIGAGFLSNIAGAFVPAFSAGTLMMYEYFPLDFVTSAIFILITTIFSILQVCLIILIIANHIPTVNN